MDAGSANPPLAAGTRQDERTLSVPVRRCRCGGPADLAVIGIVVERAFDLGVQPRDGRGGIASTVDKCSSRRLPFHPG